jgi:hypothetical protein
MVANLFGSPRSRRRRLVWLFHSQYQCPVRDVTQGVKIGTPIRPETHHHAVVRGGGTAGRSRSPAIIPSVDGHADLFSDQPPNT